MKYSAYDGMYSKHFNFPIFENDFVLIYSAGSSISVGMKTDRKRVLHEWLLSYPFYNNYDIPSKSECGWELIIDSRSQNEIKIIFGRGGETYMLTLICTDPGLKPKPIKITWE
jgi:hypothetical protein